MKAVKKEGLINRILTALFVVPLSILILEFFLRRVMIFYYSFAVDYFKVESFDYLILFKNILSLGISLWILYFAFRWVRDGTLRGLFPKEPGEKKGDGKQ